MLNDSEDESEENQFYVEGDPETFVEEIDAVETQPNEIFKCRRGKRLAKENDAVKHRMKFRSAVEESVLQK